MKSTLAGWRWGPRVPGLLPTTQPGLRTLVVGAGDAGRALVRDLLRAEAFGLAPVGYLDDDLSKRMVRRLPVLGGLEDLARVTREQQVDVVVLAIPGLPAADVRRLAAVASGAGASVRHLPSFIALLQRDVVGTDLRSLQVGELIGRPELHVVSVKVAAALTSKKVLITGAGGSIGSELCRQVRAFAPAQMVMLDHDESNLHRLQLELTGEALLDTDDVVVADIRDADRMAQIMNDFRPDVVFHAAALKHLPMLERYPCEGVKSNVQGTENVVRAAIAAGAERFVMISTDKAADPTSVLGATKQLAEVVCKATAGSSTIVSAVRFGNVLGSRGSFLTVLSEQVRNGEPVTITHPDMTRYFMTIEEAVGLVLEAARLAHGGETFVLDMGQPVRIVDLVDNYIRQLHLPRVDLRYTGLRAGEKLNEALFSELEERLPTEHPRIFSTRSALPSMPEIGQLNSLLDHLYAAAQRNLPRDVTDLLHRLLPTYRPPTAEGLALVSAASCYPDDY